VSAQAAPKPAPLRIALHEGNGSRRLSGERRYAVVRALLERGYAVACGTEEVDAPFAGESEDLLVLTEGAAAPGAPPLELPAGEGAPRLRIHVRDIGGADPAAVPDIAGEVQKSTGAHHNGGWKPWFPVIDYERCTNCMQCLSFCLFDVYGVDAASRIEVRNQEKCKTNCPACSRVCPEVAILFPKYGSGPINGDVVQAEDVAREKMKVDISALLGGDIYSLLRERHAKAASRFSKERDATKALKERMRCLAKLKEDLAIPDEVLMALPTHDQILEKARRAAAERGEGDS
jgi:Pyruvate/2-oxoacid:ferredoxin oxidoreductase delta subunit